MYRKTYEIDIITILVIVINIEKYFMDKNVNVGSEVCMVGYCLIHTGVTLSCSEIQNCDRFGDYFIWQSAI